VAQLLRPVPIVLRGHGSKLMTWLIGVIGGSRCTATTGDCDGYARSGTEA